MTTTTLDDVRPARSAAHESADRPGACEPPVRTELVAIVENGLLPDVSEDPSGRFGTRLLDRAG